MKFRAEIPYGAYWSTPFCKWQGNLQNLHSVRLAAFVARRELDRRRIPDDVFDYAVLGITIPQYQSFYGVPWFAGLAGLGHLSGPSISQACATSVRCIFAAAQEIEAGAASAALVVACDRTSNGPHLYYPNSQGPGGTGQHEDWVLDNFSCDPLGSHSMLQTAENVASKHGISTQEQHEVVLGRYQQYRQALADDQAFQKRYMTLPFEVPSPNFKKTAAQLEGDEGIFATTVQGLSRLKPVQPQGTVTFGGQTHPADGNSGLVVASPEIARRLSRDRTIAVRLLGFGQARGELAYMPEAILPASERALQAAELPLKSMDAVKSHNPFAVNDILFARQTGFDLASMNNYGCSLIWGHPQGPTGMRAILELIEELALRGGGYGLFHGCAAGDSAMALVIQVGDA